MKTGAEVIPTFTSSMGVVGTFAITALSNLHDSRLLRVLTGLLNLALFL